MKKSQIFLSIRHGFTILELLLAIAILAILGTALFSLLDNSMKAARELSDDQIHSEQITGFIDLCQQSFRTLPPGAILTGETRLMEGQYVNALILKDAPEAFNWGDPKFGDGQTILSAKPQLGGFFSINLSYDYEPDGTASSHPGIDLLRNVKELKWRFYDIRSGGWSDEWKDLSFRPSMIEMKLSMAAPEESIKFTYWVPPLQPPPANLPPG